MSKGFDSMTKTVQVPDTWREVELLQDLGYWVEDKLIHGSLVSLQAIIAKLTPEQQDMAQAHWVYAPHLRKLTVRQGFLTDYASIPRGLWFILAPAQIKRPAILHDAIYRSLMPLYKHGVISGKQFRHYRKMADELFRESMQYLEPQILSIKRSAAYRAVRAFGWMQPGIIFNRRTKKRTRGKL
jgi:hypothetical protein